MRKIQWIARQVAIVSIGGWKGASFCAMLLLSIAVLVPSAQGLPPTLAPEQILTRMEQRYEQQIQAIESYQARRRYSVSHPLLGDASYLLVEERYRAPEQKQFVILERGGPATIEKRVFRRLLDAERDTAGGAARQATDLCRRNYRFTFQTYDPAVRAYIFQVEPRNDNPYLLRGRIWVNAQDFAVQRIEGEPARRHSSLIRQTRFVHEFARFGDFWFPVRHHSETDLLLFGRATLDIRYFGYQWQLHSEVLQ